MTAPETGRRRSFDCAREDRGRRSFDSAREDEGHLTAPDTTEDEGHLTEPETTRTKVIPLRQRRGWKTIRESRCRSAR